MGRLVAVAGSLLLVATIVLAKDQSAPIGANENAADWLQRDYPSYRDEQRVQYCSFLFAPLAETDCSNSSEDKDHVSDESSEFWTAFGHRFKITDSLLVLFTAFLAAYTIRLFYATRRLALGGEDTAKRQLRAYVNVSKKKLQNIIENGVPRFVLTEKNYGQTPALRVRTLHVLRIVDSKSLGGFFLDSHNPNPEEASETVLAPGDTSRSESFLFNTDCKRWQLDADLLAQIAKGGLKRISIDGLIEYEDVFGDRHWTKFRALSAEPGTKAGMRWAPNGNEIGTYSKGQKSELDLWLEGALKKKAERTAETRAKWTEELAEAENRLADLEASAESSERDRNNARAIVDNLRKSLEEP